MDKIIRDCRSARLAAGCKCVYVPGEMEAQQERTQRAEDVPLNEATVQGIRDVAAQLRIAAAALRKGEPNA